LRSVPAAFDSTAISSDTDPAAVDFDGSGNSFSATDLANAGWRRGARLTLNGGTFAWPDVVPGRPDNVRAAGQRIALRGAGTAVQFLAAATGGTSTGRGVITYTDGGTSSYAVSVEDWSAGSWATPALTLPRWNTPAGPRPRAVRLYAVAVPATPGKAIASVTLPSDTTGGALHVFDITIRDTTAAPHGQSWTGSWAASLTGARPVPQATPWRRQTLRMVIHPNTTGGAARIRLANTFAPGPVTIGHATLAAQASRAVAAAQPVSLTFGGRPEVTIPAGAEARSDPVAFPVTGDHNLLVSLYLPGPVTVAPLHTYALTESYITRPDGGDHAGDASGTAFGGVINFWAFLTGLDVTAAGNADAIVALGDSQTDGALSTFNQNRRWPDEYSRIVRSRRPAPSIVNAGINANRLLVNRGNAAGPSALSRLDRDVLAQPNARTVILYEGVNDVVLDGAPAGQVIDAIRAIASEARRFGLRAVGATIPPAGGYRAYTDAKDNVRQEVNRYIRTSSDLDAYVDFDLATRDPLMPNRLDPRYASPDRLHFNDAGTRVLAETAAQRTRHPLLYSQTAAADVDGDQVADLLARDDATGELKAWLGRGDGAFTPGPVLARSWRSFSQTAAGDTNRDGATDLVGRDDVTGQLKVWLGRGNGTFAPGRALPGAWRGFSQTAVGDINRDGVADLLARQDATGQLKSWLGRGDGTFVPARVLAGGWQAYSQTAAGDVDGDRVADVLAREDATGELKLWLGRGDGSLMAPRALTGGWRTFSQTAVGDVSGDRIADIVARNDATGALTSWVARGDGKFGSPRVVAPGW